jgi:hypothetical protein
MTGRTADAAAQSDPDCNRQFRRWPASPIGPDTDRVYTWHAPDLPAPPPPSPARRAAERKWRRVTRTVAQ